MDSSQTAHTHAVMSRETGHDRRCSLSLGRVTVPDQFRGATIRARRALQMVASERPCLFSAPTPHVALNTGTVKQPPGR